MSEWLAVNLNKLREIGSERLAIAQQEVSLRKRREDLDRLEGGLKSLLDVAIDTSGDDRSKAQYERICRALNNGCDPLAKINKTSLTLQLLRENESLTARGLQELFASQGLEVKRNYIHTVLSQLSTKRGLIVRRGELFSLTEKGREAVRAKEQPKTNRV